MNWLRADSVVSGFPRHTGKASSMEIHGSEELQLDCSLKYFYACINLGPPPISNMKRDIFFFHLALVATPTSKEIWVTNTGSVENRSHSGRLGYRDRSIFSPGMGRRPSIFLPWQGPPAATAVPCRLPPPASQGNLSDTQLQ